jgi:hypothetical protein
MLFGRTAEVCKNFVKILCKILLPAARTSLSSLESFLTIVLGGTAALHAYRAWGAVIFCRQTSGVLFLLVIMLLLDCRVQRNAQSQMAKIQC